MFIDNSLSVNKLSLTNFASGGSIGTATSTVDRYAFIQINQTTTGQTLILPTPSITGVVKRLIIYNSGTASFLINSKILLVGDVKEFYWNGSSWVSNLSSDKRQETYTGTTNASGVYTVVFPFPYTVAPNVQANITNQSSTNQFLRIASVTTTGFTINTFLRNSVNLLGIDVLLFTTANAPGAVVDVLVTEK